MNNIQTNRGNTFSVGNAALKWLSVVVWCVIIYMLSDQPGLATPLSFDFVLRKVAHVVVYMILTFLTLFALRSSGVSVGRALIGSLIFSVLYAISDEVHQSFVETRVGSVLDVGIDSLGIVAATFASRKYFR